MNNIRREALQLQINIIILPDYRTVMMIKSLRKVTWYYDPAKNGIRQSFSESVCQATMHGLKASLPI